VFFELGIADQWHWPVLLAEKETDLPFDVRHYRALIYGELGEDLLTRALAAAIGATLDGGKKDRAAVDAAAPPPRAEPRVLGRFMSQVHVWGLEREGSLEHFPVDLLFLVEDVRSEVDQRGRALAKDFPKREGVMSPPSRVTQEAEKSGLIQKNYDPAANEWYFVLTGKGLALLNANARFSEELRRRGSDR
jgi:hypothetical protein